MTCLMVMNKNLIWSILVFCALSLYLQQAVWDKIGSIKNLLQSICRYGKDKTNQFDWILMKVEEKHSEILLILFVYSNQKSW